MGSAMTVTWFRVTNAGPLVTFQNSGRPGHLRFGVGASGPMDCLSYATANRAVGNLQPETAIEISMGGLVLECLSGAITMAVVGGEFQIEVGGQKFASGAVFTVQSGETLSIKPGRLGNWCYLSFAGVVSANEWLGQTATHASTGFGGGALTVGQELCVEHSKVFTHREGIIEPFAARSSNGFFRIVLGPQDHHFSPEAKQLLLGSEFSLSGAYDRMGVRLTGPALPLGDSLSIPSEPIIKGSIQVSGDGVPTALLADHQTTGGYPKIATLISTDIDEYCSNAIAQKISFHSHQA